MWRTPLIRKIAVLLLYTCTAVIMTWPLAARLSTHLPGKGGDLWVHWWNLWWLRRSFLGAHSPFYTSLIFYPYGASLTYHNFAWLHFLIWFPLHVVFGPVRAFGVVHLALLTLSGYAMFVLVRETTGGDLWAAWTAGIVYAFWPYTQSHFDHPNFKATPWFPLLVLFLERSRLRRRWKDAFQAALAVVLLGLTRLQFLILALLLILVYLLCLTFQKRLPDRQTFFRLAASSAVAFVLLLPILFPLLMDIIAHHGVPNEVMIREEEWGQTDLMAYILPSRYHPLWGKAVSPWYKPFVVNKVYTPFLGYSTLFLATLGAIFSRRHSTYWIVLTIAIFSLALGPTLRLNGHIYEIPMPYRFVAHWLPLQVFRKPDRFNVVLSLPIAALAGWGIVFLRKRLPFPRAPLLLFLSLLILFEYLILPYPTVQPTAPRWFETLAGESGEFAIVNLPFDPALLDKEYMAYQVIHGKPIVGGKTSRMRSDLLRFIEAHPLLSGLYHKAEMDTTLRDVSRQLRSLADENIRYLVLHKEHTDPDRLARWRDWLTITPIYEDAEIAVYRTHPQWGEDFQFKYPLSSTIGLLDFRVIPTSTTQGGWFLFDARWGSSAPPGQRLNVHLEAQAADGEDAWDKVFPLFPEWPTDQWPADTVVRDQYLVQVDPFSPTGAFKLHVALIDVSSNRQVGKTITVGQIYVQPLPRQFDIPEGILPLQADFGKEIRLLGYNLSKEAEHIYLTVYWQALQRMQTDYKIFVHLIDSATKNLVTQSDVMPREWTYPTTWWEAGEVVEDSISLSLTGIPPGRYLLKIGIYAPETGNRLPVTDARGRPLAEDAVLLTVVEIGQ